MRERAGMFDTTSFAKYEVSGSDAPAVVDRLCANALPRMGRMALAQVLTPQGTIQCDVTIRRIAEDRFYVISAAATPSADPLAVDPPFPR